MKREYSFNEISRITMGAPQNENKPPSQPYFTSSKQPRDSWTDMRVEQIKKKYDTPSHRKNHSNVGSNNISKENQAQSLANAPYASYRNPLKDSVASPNIVRKDKMNTSNNYSQYAKEENHLKNNWQQSQYVPRFSFDSKENTSFMEKFSQIKNSMKYQAKAPLKDNSTSSAGKYRQYQQGQTHKIDPRVQNIDKINMKIKKILDCLNENEKHTKQDTRGDLGASFMKRSILSKDNQQQQLEETKILSRQKVAVERQVSTNSNVNKLNLKASISSNEKYVDKYADKFADKYGDKYGEKYGDKYTDNYNQKYGERHSLSPQVRQQTNTKWKLEEKYKYFKNGDSIINDNANFNNINVNLNKNSIINPNATKKMEDNTDSWFEPTKKPEDKNRSRSCLENFKYQDIKLNSGKKLDDQISKINGRIKQFEEEKKKLNIDFKPYNCQIKYNRSTTNLADNRTQRSSKPPLPKAYNNKSTDFNPFTPLKSQVSGKVKTEASQYQQRYTLDTHKISSSQQFRPLSRINSASLKLDSRFENLRMEEKRQKSRTPQFQEREKPSHAEPILEYESVNYQEKYSQSKEQTPQLCRLEPSQPQRQKQNNTCSEQLKLKTEEGIQQRKRKLLETATVSFSRQTKRLITNLFEQVKIDQELRNAKIWFRDQVNSNKWQLLKQESQRCGFELQKQEFQVTQEEDNPFYSVRQSQQTYSCLIQRWVRAEKYWRQNISHQFNLREFEVEKFTSQKVDLERKGYFVVQDLVRFLNMETGTFYRNRDLILIFRRLTESDKLHWSQFMKNLDQQQQS